MSGFRLQIEEYLRREALPEHKYGHQPRLYALTREIAAKSLFTPAYDDDVVFAAAFLHDLGVFIGHRPEDPLALARWNHIAYTCDHAPVLLGSWGFPADKVEAVVSCIREHQPHDEPHSFEATLLRDADILEQLGAIGILRTSSKLGSDTRFHFLSDVRTSLRHSLNTLPVQIRLEATQLLAAPRISVLQSFLAALDAEAGVHLD
jgi:uncharacterized protein